MAVNQANGRTTQDKCGLGWVGLGKWKRRMEIHLHSVPPSMEKDCRCRRILWSGRDWISQWQLCGPELRSYLSGHRGLVKTPLDDPGAVRLAPQSWETSVAINTNDLSCPYQITNSITIHRQSEIAFNRLTYLYTNVLLFTRYSRYWVMSRPL